MKYLAGAVKCESVLEHLKLENCVVVDLDDDVIMEAYEYLEVHLKSDMHDDYRCHTRTLVHTHSRTHVHTYPHTYLGVSRTVCTKILSKPTMHAFRRATPSNSTRKLIGTFGSGSWW